jgi:hypothetical protein
VPKLKQNERHVAMCANSYRRSKEKKAKRRADQETRHQLNRATVQAGGMTPWQLAQASRRALRAGVQRTV